MPDILFWDLDYTDFSTASPSQPHRKHLELFMQSSIINVSPEFRGPRPLSSSAICSSAFSYADQQYNMSHLSAPSGVWAYARFEMLSRFENLGKPDPSKLYGSKPHYLTKVTGEKACSSKVHGRKLENYARIEISGLRCPMRHRGERSRRNGVRVSPLALTDRQSAHLPSAHLSSGWQWLHTVSA